MTASRLSLRSGFAWTAAGNIFNGVSQWAVLSIIARLGSAELLGQWALALAVANPLAMLAHLNLRAVVATDVAGHHPFSDYMAVRNASNIAAVLALAALAVPLGWPVLLLGGSILIDNTSDLLYGAMQRVDRLDLAAQSTMLRAIVSLSFVGVAMWQAGNIAAAAAGHLAGRALTLLLWDWPRSGIGLMSEPRKQPVAVFRQALPLGLALLLISLTTNIPRYAIEAFAGTRELGIFAAVASFVVAGGTLVNALGQSAATPLARHYAAADRLGFKRLLLRLVGLAIAIGLIGVLGASAVGGPLLALIYGAEFGPYAPVLVATLAAGALGWVAQLLGFGSTAMRVFGRQLPLFAAACATSALVSFAAVPALGLYGAAVAMAAAGFTAIAGQLLILRRGL